MTYPRGATYVVRVKIVNDGTNSGTHRVELSPGEGTEFELLYGFVRNGDTAGRVTRVGIATAAGAVDLSATAFFVNQTLAAGGNESYPTPRAGLLGPGGRYLVSGPMVLKSEIGAVSVSEDTYHEFVLRIFGAVPTVTVTSPTGATETTEVERIM